MVDFMYKNFLTTERSVQLDDLFDICKNCEAFQNKGNMSAIPQGAFAAKKIRKNIEQEAEFPSESATRYNSKYMNSIWGMYNRFSVFNLKKLMENQHANKFQMASASYSQLSTSAERLYLPL